MGARNPHRRTSTASALAERYDVHPRTIRREMAEPRALFEARARRRQTDALALRQQGRSYREIGERLGVTKNAAASLVRRAQAKRTV